MAANNVRCSVDGVLYLGKVNIVFDYLSGQTALEKVRAGEGASASTRGACAPQKLTGLRGQF